MNIYSVQEKPIALIGMSGAGKSYWAQQLARFGYAHICCDDLIEKKLASLLKKHGYKGIQDVSRWLGQPYESQYNANQSHYLRCERSVIRKIIGLIQKRKLDCRTVIDTTGSVIYVDPALCNLLKKYTRVVYLYTPAKVRKEMFEQYLRDPKPVLWGNMFEKRNNENNRSALARCYPKLLAYRTNRYKQYAHATIPYHRLRSPEFSAENFIQTCHEA